MHSIMVIDDDWRARSEHYQRLEAELKLNAPELDIHLCLVESPQQIVPWSRRYQPCAAIVDAVLEPHWSGFSLRQALDDLGCSTPFAVLSKFWDTTNADQIEEALRRPNWAAFLHWRDIQGDGQIAFAVRSITKMVYDKLRASNSIGLRPHGPVRLVHISDIQTGGFDIKDLKLEANRSADVILRHWKGETPTFVAFTGDVAEHGSPDQYNRARDWIHYFFERLKLGPLPSDRLLYVPGNHDVNLSLGAASRIAVTTSPKNGIALSLSRELQHPELAGFSYAPFRRFLTEVSRCPLLSGAEQDYSLAWVEARFRYLGIVFYGINTAQPPNPFGLPGREVSADGLTAISDELQRVLEGSDNNPLVVGLGHHTPISAGGDDGVDNPHVFDKFFRGRPRTAVFLHGHTHRHVISYARDDGLRLVRSCATTLTKKESARPPDSLRGFNLLEFNRSGNRVQSLRCWSYVWLGTDLKSPDEPSCFELHDDGMFHDVPNARVP